MNYLKMKMIDRQNNVCFMAVNLKLLGDIISLK
jgi:hypothetical protein